MRARESGSAYSRRTDRRVRSGLRGGRLGRDTAASWARSSSRPILTARERRPEERAENPCAEQDRHTERQHVHGHCGLVRGRRLRRIRALAAGDCGGWKAHRVVGRRRRVRRSRMGRGAHVGVRRLAGMSRAVHREDAQSEHDDEQQAPQGTSCACAPTHLHTDSVTDRSGSASSTVPRRRGARWRRGRFLLMY